MGDRVLVAAEALTDEITGTNNCLQKRIDGARSCVSSLEAYCTETKVKGAAYSNSQQYYTNTYIPLLNQVVYACEELIELNNTILPTFSRYVPSTRGFAADTLVIENEIARLNEENTYFQDQIEYYARAMMPVPPFYYAPDYSGIILWYQGRIWINNYVIGELQKIIEGLQSFNSECAGLFDETDALVSKLSAAVTQLRFASNWNSSANRYIVPSPLADKLSEIEYEKLWKSDGSIDYVYLDSLSEKKQKEILEMYMQNSTITNEEKDSLFDSWTHADVAAKSGLITALAQFAKNGLESALQDGAAEKVTELLVTFIQRNNPLPVFAAATVYGSTVDIVDSSFVQSVMGKAAKAAPFIGCALDVGMQIASGEDVGDAIVKASAHTLIGTGLTVAATAIIGATPVGWAAAGVFALGVGASMLFDWAYDRYADDAKHAIGTFADQTVEVLGNVGDAISETFSGLCALFA